MENRKGSGIFLGVIGVATLVVAIIGATFSFFTAQITDEDTNVEAQAYVFATTMSIAKVANTPTAGSGIIPMENDDLITAVNKTANPCVDKNGYEGCVLYSVTFNNTANNSVTLDGTMLATTNTFVNEHLHFVELTGNTVGSLAKSTDHVLANPTTSTPYNLTNEVTVGAKSTTTIYFVVYLEELENENKNDAGQSFVGSLTYQATTGETLTADFSA